MIEEQKTLASKTKAELRVIAIEHGLTPKAKDTKADLIAAILAWAVESTGCTVNEEDPPQQETPPQFEESQFVGKPDPSMGKHRSRRTSIQKNRKRRRIIAAQSRKANRGK